jgi:hypothetical protein
MSKIQIFASNAQQKLQNPALFYLYLIKYFVRKELLLNMIIKKTAE